MPINLDEDYYKLGNVKIKPDGPRPLKCGTYGVILGERAEELGHLEWMSFCKGSLKSSKWFAYRIGPGENGNGTRTDLLDVFDTKTVAVGYLTDHYGSKFDKVF